jgi:hypothetical protein
VLGQLRQVAPEMGKPAGDDIISRDIVTQLNGFTFDHQIRHLHPRWKSKVKDKKAK